MSETKKHREYQLVWDEIDGWSVGSLNNSECYSNMHVIEYQALVEEKQKTAEMLEAIRLSAGFAHAVQPGGPMEQILDKLIKKYGDL